jgi:hypothetical protein
MSGDHNMNEDSGWRKRQIALDIKAENARELGLDYEPVFTYGQVKAHIQAAILSEREACAKVCDDKHDTWRWDDEADSASGPRDCAAAIRNRENT